MNKIQQRIAWGALMILLLGGAGVLQLRPVRAGGPIIVVSGAAATWDSGRRDFRGLGSRSYEGSRCGDRGRWCGNNSGH